MQENGEPLQRGSRIGRPVNWLVDGWTGGPIKSAFVHLHLALVGLVDLYTEDDIKAHSPSVLARMQHCLAPTDRRRQEAEVLFGGGQRRVHRHDQSAADWHRREQRRCRQRRGH